MNQVVEIKGRVQKIYDGTDFQTGEVDKNQPSVVILDEETFEQHKFRISKDDYNVLSKKINQIITMKGLMTKSQEVVVKPAEYQGSLLQNKKPS